MIYRDYEIDILDEPSGFSVQMSDSEGNMVYEAYEFDEAIDAQFAAEVAIERYVCDGHWPV